MRASLVAILFLSSMQAFAARADTCPNFSGSYSGTRTVTYTNINVNPPADVTTSPGPSPKYTIIQKDCQVIEIDTIGDGQLFGSGKAVYPIGGLSSQIGSTLEQGFSLASGLFSDNKLILAIADRNPDGESTGTSSFIFTTLSKNTNGKLAMSTTYNVYSPAGQQNIKYIEVFQEK
jgi:hypothetical protein